MSFSEKNNPNKAHDTIFMHKMYCVCSVDNEPHIVKITIEEFATVNGEAIKRLYNLQDLKIEPLRIIGLTDNQLRPSVLNGSDINISDLFQIVKAFDKIAAEEFASGEKDTLKRIYNMQSIKIEPLRHVAFTDKRLALSVLNDSDINISDLFQIVKTFDKDFYLNKRNEKQIENFPIGDERINNMAETTQELLERIATLEKQIILMANLKEQINTVNRFIFSITVSEYINTQLNKDEITESQRESPRVARVKTFITTV